MRLLWNLLKVSALFLGAALVAIKIVYQVSWKEAAGIAEEFARDVAEDLTS
ncbi:MAG: hypothetical protein AB1505_08250 [Candidatus Latescibacterota bacterium]